MMMGGVKSFLVGNACVDAENATLHRLDGNFSRLGFIFHKNLKKTYTKNI
jgi:hypothetical protein